MASIIFVGCGTDGAKYEVTYCQNDKEVAKVTFSENGSIIKKTGQIPDGIVKGYGKNGILVSEGNYLNGKKNGLVKDYYENGAVSSEWNFKADKEDGICKNYDKKGNISMLWTFKEGKKDGLYRTYYASGKPWSEINFKNDKKDGLEKQYYKNGNIESESNYIDGKLSGLSKSYYENGVIKDIATNKNGYCVNDKNYDEKGKLISNKDYPSNDSKDKPPKVDSIKIK